MYSSLNGEVKLIKLREVFGFRPALRLGGTSQDRFDDFFTQDEQGRQRLQALSGGEVAAGGAKFLNSALSPELLEVISGVMGEVSVLLERQDVTHLSDQRRSTKAIRGERERDNSFQDRP